MRVEEVAEIDEYDGPIEEEPPQEPVQPQPTVQQAREQPVLAAADADSTAEAQSFRGSLRGPRKRAVWLAALMAATIIAGLLLMLVRG
jgi:hypothetical protein